MVVETPLISSLEYDIGFPSFIINIRSRSSTLHKFAPLFSKSFRKSCNAYL